jgi:hypothetical protein
MLSMPDGLARQARGRQAEKFMHWSLLNLKGFGL